MDAAQCKARARGGREGEEGVAREHSVTVMNANTRWALGTNYTCTDTPSSTDPASKITRACVEVRASHLWVKLVHILGG